MKPSQVLLYTMICACFIPLGCLGVVSVWGIFSYEAILNNPVMVEGTFAEPHGVLYFDEETWQLSMSRTGKFYYTVNGQTYASLIELDPQTLQTYISGQQATARLVVQGENPWNVIHENDFSESRHTARLAITFMFWIFCLAVMVGVLWVIRQIQRNEDQRAAAYQRSYPPQFGGGFDNEF